ncbi:hypothetical protein E5288_WYG009738 [Bos mutus]|uniref:Uncharacterized protein n=1 Tax=Bos mutus TaxID=72004 RepID=A0A6B0QZ33_9CETA|nr:hypothetical protein [Bos mutus]
MEEVILKIISSNIYEGLKDKPDIGIYIKHLALLPRCTVAPSNCLESITVTESFQCAKEIRIQLSRIPQNQGKKAKEEEIEKSYRNNLKTTKGQNYAARGFFEDLIIVNYQKSELLGDEAHIFCKECTLEYCSCSEDLKRLLIYLPSTSVKSLIPSRKDPKKLSSVARFKYYGDSSKAVQGWGYPVCFPMEECLVAAEGCMQDVVGNILQAPPVKEEHSKVQPNAHPCVSCESWVCQVLGLMPPSPQLLQSTGLQDQLCVIWPD